MDLFEELKWRGLIFQTSNEAGLKELLKNPITLYQGFDPTADSLHVGNFLGILMLRRFQLAGHTPITLAGGGTGLIGDPGGRTSERQLNPEATVAAWNEKIKSQLGKLLDFDHGKNKAVLVNNYDWLGKVSAIGLMREVGKHFPVSEMLQKESVSARLETGISYTEFSYMILQAYDYMELFGKYNCELQIGGSDQWGNITAGVSLIRKVKQKEVHAMTMPLVVASDGKKFGKSEGNAVWLDATKTSPYQLYQFWMGTDDRDAVRFLKYYTFLSKTEIENIENEFRQKPEERLAQRVLASEVTGILHGKEAREGAERVSRALFSGNLHELNKADLEMCYQALFRLSDKIDLKDGAGLLDFLVKTSISSSKRQAKEDIESGSVMINGGFVKSTDFQIKKQEALFREFTVIRRGKKNYYIYKWD